MRDFPWIGDVETVVADVGDAESVSRALEGVDVAYYLVHSIGTGGSFEDTDREAARTFAAAAERAGVSRIVYLGGLTPEGEELSPHLRSREEVGRTFLDSAVPAAVLQAAVVLGSGSASFEMLRHLTERLPVMVVPKWVDTRVQPIAIRDVLRYLVGVADLPPDVDRAFDIGGPDVLTYRDMMLRLRRGGRPAEAAHADGPGPLAHPVQPLGRPRHAGARKPRPAARREPAQHGGVPRARHRRVGCPTRPAGLIGFREAVRAGPGPHP